VSCLLARNGHGVSHAIGVGGRDLKEEVGGIMALMAIDALDGDPGTAAIVIISKPPAAAGAAKILERVAQSPKPFTICFLGAEALELPANARQAGDLRSAAEAAMGGVAIAAAPGAVAASDIAHRISGARREIKGLYCGGTMCAEAQLVLRRAGLQVASNAPVPGARRSAGAAEPGHVLLDLGEDEYTIGRPHPMIDPSLRDQMIRQAMSDPLTAIVLIDVVIGHGAHPDPAGELAGLLGKAGQGSPVVIASVCGTEQDPQVYSRQVEALTKAGVIVAPSNAHAAELAIAVLENIS
jgi:FdrA protein